jgi:hypothetical protein
MASNDKGWRCGATIADHPLQGLDGQFGDHSGFVHDAFMSLIQVCSPGCANQ